MKKYFIVDKTLFTEDYLTAIKIILENAGYQIKEDEEDLKIFIPDDDTMAWALRIFKDCHLV